MSNWTSHDLTEQLGNLRRNGHLEMLRQEAHEAGLPFAWVLAIASRETNCRNVLGDYREGEPHGVGLMQVDIQHEFAREMRDDGTWVHDARRLVRYACGLINDLIHEVSQQTDEEDNHAVQRMVSAAYNCGLRRMIEGHLIGNCDERTTGQDYGADVMQRFAVFLHLLDQE